MAGTSPRRSIRSRTGQPTNSNSHHSSTSSNSSGRADRATRISVKAESPQKSTPGRSLSSEPPDESIAQTIEESLQTRRRKRGQPEEPDKSSIDTPVDMSNGVTDAAEDDEAVRCICGMEDYPGPPQITEEDSKKGIKDSSEIELITAEDYTEDLAGFFLQCDMCKVWQHGGCVGIKNEGMSPDEYFCEQCRKDLHKIFTASNGQKYSHYLPLYQTVTPGTSRAASFSKDGTRSPRGKNGRPSSSVQSASNKRRSTMNSRDAAYDEEEQLRRAIEASKGEKTESTDGGTRRAKRGRSDSEEKQGSSKRQRTLSNSPTPQNDVAQFASKDDSDDPLSSRNGTKGRIRGAAARNHKEKEAREERERSRQEAASKRKGRAERRRIDESDAGEEPPAATRPSVEKVMNTVNQADPPPSSQPTPESPPKEKQPSTSHKKGGRPPHTRKGKLGKNQYTRDRDTIDGENSPARSQSRGVGGDDSSNRGGNPDGKSGRSKGGGHKFTMVDMRRKVALMLDFISKTQLDMAGETTPTTDDANEKIMRGLAGSLMPILQAQQANSEASKGTPDSNNEPKKDFKDLSLLEMMDVLTRELVKWQKQFT